MNSTPVSYSSSTEPKRKESEVKAQTHEFKSETSSLLDIVANSLYSERDVFLRELVSNACDALEKLRYNSITSGKELPELEIKITTEEGALTISDNGIGMSEKELHENLGTIARSGSKAFMQQIERNESKDKIIGRFGVGFYAAFMVADKVEVKTSHYLSNECFMWTSDGKGKYSIEKLNESLNGTQIKLYLKESEKEFSKESKILDIVKKHSAFVTQKIKVNDKIVDFETAIWKMDGKDITQEQHNKIFKKITDSYSDPLYSLSYQTDSPISLRAVLYVPSNNTEAFGFEKMDHGLSLYSRGTLIKNQSKELIPEWLRFVKGVVDSEDVPLNLSREMLQSGTIVNNIKRVITNRVIKWLTEEMNNDKKKFSEFVQKFSPFIKEGVCTSTSDKNKESLINLLTYDTSNRSQISLKKYVEDAKNNKNIFYIFAPEKDIALQSPYLESFKRANIEVILVYNALDEYVFNNLRTYNDHKFINIESNEAKSEIEKLAPKDKIQKSESQVKGESELCDWVLDALPKGQVKAVKISDNCSSYPALITDHDPAAYRMMQYFALSNTNSKEELPQQPVTLELNSNNSIIKGLSTLMKTNPDLAKEIALQIFDNAKIAIGILNDSRPMLPRINSFLEGIIGKASSPNQGKN